MNKSILYFAILLIMELSSITGQMNYPDGGLIDTTIPRRGCGYRPHGLTRRVIGSTQKGITLFAEFPWTVAVFELNLKNGKISEKPLVDGSLIHRQAVLTTAHNFYRDRSPDELIIRAGDWNLNYTNEPLLHQDRRVTKIIKHPNFDFHNLYENLVILILTEPMEYAGNVNPVCLHDMIDSNSISRCVVSGWSTNNYGRKEEALDSILHFAELPLVQRGVCEKAIHYRAGPDKHLHHSFLCAGGENSTDLCLDGSPLVCPIEGSPDRYVQVGIAQWGFQCKKGVPGVYVNIMHARKWIAGVLSENRVFNYNY